MNGRFTYNLLQMRNKITVGTLLKGHPKVKFVFVDVNCSLCIHLQDGSWKYFNTFEELESIAVKLGEFESIDALEES